MAGMSVGQGSVCSRVWFVAGLVVFLLGLVVPSASWGADAPPSRERPQEIPSEVQRVFATENDALDIDGMDDWRVDVDVAIIDTGIQLDHPDLNVFARTDCTGATWPFTGPDYECTSASSDDGDDDAYGVWHGSTAAANIAALDNNIGKVGIAAGARLWSVDVSGYERYNVALPIPTPAPTPTFDLESVVAGVRWVTEHADEIEVAYLPVICVPDAERAGLPSGLPAAPYCDEPGGAGLVAELEDAIADSVAEGVVYVFSAGAHYQMDSFVPQRFGDMLTVSTMLDSDGKPGSTGADGCPVEKSPSSVTEDDHTAGISSWGDAIDIAAPAHNCAGSWASAHVAGAAAVLASYIDPNDAADVDYIRDLIHSAGNDDWTEDSPDSTPERLLDVSDPAVFNPQMAAGSTPSGGWSHDLQVRCAKSMGSPSGINYYEDTAQCGPDGRNWSVFVDVKNPVGSCPAASPQAFAVNGTGSPAILGWYQYWGSPLGPNWTVNLKLDNVYTNQACVGSNTATQLGFGKHVDLAGGPLPHPSELSSSHQMAYSDWRPNGGKTRLVASAVLRWGGKNRRIEVNLNSGNVTDQHAAPEVIQIENTTNLERLVLDGTALGYGVPSDYTSTTHTIQWKDLLAQAFEESWLSTPTTGQETLAVYMAVETTGDEMATLWTMNFRVNGKN